MTDEELDVLAAALYARLSAAGMTLSAAESCTGGLFGKIVTDISGVSDVYMGGVCTYSNKAKTTLLGVMPEALAVHGAVSETVAAAMSEGVCRLFQTDAGVGITGIAGPKSDDTEKPVGLIYVSVTVRGQTVVKKLCHSFTDNVRDQNRRAAVRAALLSLTERIPVPGKEN